jgi:hypothetical protein
LVDCYQRFGGTYCHHLTGGKFPYNEDGGSRLFRNIDNDEPDYTALHTRRVILMANVSTTPQIQTTKIEKRNKAESKDAIVLNCLKHIGYYLYHPP